MPIETITATMVITMSPLATAMAAPAITVTRRPMTVVPMVATPVTVRHDGDDH